MSPSTLPLSGRIALVAGASRGAGRGIAVELGAAGATVIVTGRSTRARPADTYGEILGMSDLTVPPGTIEDTADAVTAAGGRGVPRECDHGDPEAVETLVADVETAFGPIDLLVNNAWGGHESFDGRFAAPFWEHPLSHWAAMMDGGARLHLLTARAVAPRMVARRRGLIVATTFWDRDRFLSGNLYYDLAKATITRLAFAMAGELRPHGVASLAVSPGWMRTEWVLTGHRTDEAHWQDVPALARTESPRYLGRAVAALAADPDVLRHSGQVMRVADLAETHGFTDIDGRKVPAFELG
jgi:NAD(P)-dependent dehydrogenase (short-subunit alcohol dehydrogenase family)